MLLIEASEIPRLLPLTEAIPLMRRAFGLISAARASTAPRQVLPLENGTGLLMGAAAADTGIVGKLVAVMPANRRQGLPGSTGMLLLMDASTGEPLALMDGTTLTAHRTAAANGLVIDLLARADARRGLLVGCGTQAAAQAGAMDAVRDLEEIRVLGRDLQEAERFVRAHQERVGAVLRPVGDPASALDAVDLVVSATNSLEPVIPGDRVPPGCHVSGIGSFRADMREFDLELLARAAIFVESRVTALEEAGELIAARDAGCTSPAQWTEVGEVLDGAAAGRTDRQQCTFFKSVGHAAYDLVAARAVYDAARERGVGTHWQNR
jgi:ornithine cyclodeaminase/alanine dehydrogenase-like protein (mu-crystallin family)